MDLQVDVLLINVGCEEPSLLVLVSHVLVHGNVEDKSGTDDVNYIVVSQEHVMDGIASLMARCIMLNPKAKV
ncbi:hypothetical protein HanXRQr2_Chr06g0273851 [Helianthus annuus]|uniref:Uncharacterized protein n=1 Tax=Helianthus annuus TaxID=4232 RepID=A0A9K3NKK5_HELAN|nr:hypothetical protein HanXRQr2_Chr06g0273851 [Helianthus annuus]KAJ0561564.1 hypothetical protein HanHA300_Chr06g0224421 [Helianthus annuus]KAJ0574629.1 hypothetical protein HanHA89_Chr06g0240381 [Helianthus annuus]KAJ0738959.1 hypothetical protein HanLR1_Chr06g0224281 [Helianthus annuus]KAJ0741828.1 hypothetical protein HanOQP8_Chr06g0232561 [Helianthus annuus]